MSGSRAAAVALRRAVVLAACLGLPRPAEGKLEAGTLHLGGELASARWGYLGKFGYAVGTGGTYDVRFRLRPGDGAAAPAPSVDLEIFLDEDWDYALTLNACQRAKDGPAKRTFPKVTLGGQPGEWGPWTSGTISQTIRPHIWYFAASSCGPELISRFVDLDFEVRMRQFDGSELGFEMRWMPCVSAAVLACLTVFLGCFGQRCRSAARSMGSLHAVILALGAAVSLQWGALLLEVLHLWLYQANGTGAPVVDALSGAMDMLSQVVTVTLLIAIARGYSLACAKTCEPSGLQQVALAVAVLHVALVFLDKWGGEASYEHHENGGALGLILLVARMLLFAWFTKEVSELQASAGLKLEAFLRRFQVAGSAYLLAYPGLFLAVQVFAPYLRHPLLQVGLLAVQTASAFWLAGLFLSRGSYYEVSSMSSSLLPGGGRHCAGAGAPGKADTAWTGAGPDLLAGAPLRRRGGC